MQLFNTELMREKGFTPVIVILLLALVSALGYIAYLKGYINLSPRVVITPAPYPIETKPTPTADPTANWKKYSNPDYKVSFKYPLTWTLKEEGIQSQLGDKYNYSIEMQKKDSKIQIYLNMNGIGGMTQTLEGEPIDIDGNNLFLYHRIIESIKTKQYGISNSLTTLGVFMLNNTTYSIILSFPTDYSKTEENLVLSEFKQILSTFKFTQ